MSDKMEKEWRINDPASMTISLYDGGKYTIKFADLGIEDEIKAIIQGYVIDETIRLSMHPMLSFWHTIDPTLPDVVKGVMGYMPLIVEADDHERIKKVNAFCEKITKVRITLKYIEDSNEYVLIKDPKDDDFKQIFYDCPFAGGVTHLSFLTDKKNKIDIFEVSLIPDFYMALLDYKSRVLKDMDDD